MDEMNNKNELDWYPTANPAPQEEAKPEVAEAPAQTSEDPSSFAYNDDPNKGNTYYNYQPGVDGVYGGYSEPVAPLDNSAAQEKAKKAMIMGIIAAGIVTTCACFPVGIILGIIALVNVSRAKKLSITGRMPGLAIPGLVCGIYGLAMSLFWIFYFGIFALVFILEGISGGFGEEVYLALSRLL